MKTTIIKNIATAALVLPVLASCASLRNVSENTIYAKTNGKAGYVAPRAITEKRKFGTPYTVMGQDYYPLSSSEGYVEEGVASWYGADFHGKKTANGETYNMYDMTAAHTSIPLPTFMRVTNLENGRVIIVRVNDRGPFVKNRVIDLSYRAAVELAMHKKGTARVRLEALPTDGSPLLRSGQAVLRQAEIQQQDIQPIQPVSKNYTPIIHKSSGFTHRISAKNGVDTAANSATETTDTQGLDVVDNAVEQKVEDNSIYGKVHYYIQTGAFSGMDNAQRQVSTIKDFIENVSIHEHKTADRTLFRVRVGPMASKADADVAFKTLSTNGYANASVIIDGNK